MRMIMGVMRGAAVAVTAATAMLRVGALLVWTMTRLTMARLLLTVASGTKGEMAGGGTEE